MNTTEKQQLFLEQYHALFQYVYRYIAYRIDSKAEVEDLVSHILLKAYEDMKRFDPEKGSIRQWVTGIMKFTLADYWKKRKIIIEFDEGAVTQQIDHAHIEQDLDEKIRFQSLIQPLPCDIQRLFILHYVDDLTYDDIARLTNKKPATIRKLFSRFHARLAESLTTSL